MTPGHIRATADLTWFFEHGVPAFERSAMGPMLERAALFHVRHVLERETLLARFARKPHEPPIGQVTARPMREVHTSQRDEPDRRTSVRYGEVRGRLMRIAAMDPQAARALGFGLGDEGATWTRHERGRCVALFPLVPAGIALIARARRALPPDRAGASDRHLLRVELVLDAITKGRDPARRQLIKVATREANELLTRALTLWVLSP